MSDWRIQGYGFSIDRKGVPLANGVPLDESLYADELGWGEAIDQTAFEAFLSARTAEHVHDEEGIYDLAMTDSEGSPVAALIVSLEDDGLSIAGERAATFEVSDLLPVLKLAFRAPN